MARKGYRARHIYEHTETDGWLLVGHGGVESIEGGHRITLTFYDTEREHVATRVVTNMGGNGNSVDRFLRHTKERGAKLGPYEGEQPETDTRFAEQPRAVRMQRHAPDIYDALGHVRGMSPAMALRAAEAFGSTWAEKTDAETWQERVQSCGEGRSKRFANALK